MRSSATTSTGFRDSTYMLGAVIRRPLDNLQLPVYTLRLTGVASRCYPGSELAVAAGREPTMQRMAQLGRDTSVARFLFSGTCVRTLARPKR
jgi:hypothetical protein